MGIYSIKKDNEVIGKITSNIYIKANFYIWEYIQKDVNKAIKIYAKLDSNLYLNSLDYELVSKNLKVKKQLQCNFKNGLWINNINNEQIITKKRFCTMEMMQFLPLPKDKKEICLLDPISLKYIPIDYIQYPEKSVITVPEQYIIKYDDGGTSSIKSLIYDLEIIKKKII